MGKAILIVDDDSNILDTARDILEDAGYTVYSAQTGSAALIELKAVPADLVMLDYNLPDVKGVELALEAKALRPKAAIVLMTGEAHVDLGAAQGAINAVLTKPVNPAELLRVIQSLVDS